MQTLIHQVLEIARWAPSGDNCQPWRFRILSEKAVVIVPHFELEDDMYDFERRPSFLAIGCLLESIKIAANQYRHKIEWRIQQLPHTGILVTLVPSENDHDPFQLLEVVESRSVNREPYTKKTLEVSHKEMLISCVSEKYEIKFYDTKEGVRDFVRLSTLGTYARFLLKRAHHIHQHVLKWVNHTTPTGIPGPATGLSRPVQYFLKSIFDYWRLVYFINRYLGGNWFASLQMDKLPGKGTAAYYTLSSSKAISAMSKQELIEAGMEIQRVWLLMSKLGIDMQPCYTPIIFYFYYHHHPEELNDAKALSYVKKLMQEMARMSLDDKIFFIARCGYPRAKTTDVRSGRLELSQLILSDETQ